MKTERLWEEPLDMCRKPFIISVPSIALPGKNIWKSVMILISVKVTRQWKNQFYDAVYSPVILILNAVVVAAVMLISASGNKMVLTFFGMSAGTAVAVINYISQIFFAGGKSWNGDSDHQSAVAGIHRINEFFGLEEKKMAHRRMEYRKTWNNPATKIEENRNEKD